MITIRTNSGLSARCFGERNDMRMKIVILDGYAENPGDLSWDPIGTLGELTVYDRTPPDQIASRIGEAEIVFTNKTPLTAAVFEACPALRYVGVLATGYNVVDLAAATAHAACTTASDLKADMVITVSKSGETARLLSRCRPEQPIIACVMEEQVQRHLALSWGVIPLLMPYARNTDELIDFSVQAAQEAGLVQDGDLAVLTAGVPVGISGTTNMIKVHLVGDSLLTGVGVGKLVSKGPLCVCRNLEEVQAKFHPGDVLVVPFTNNDMLEYMRQASAVITEDPGLNSHAAIVGLTLAKAVIVGAAGATRVLKDDVRVSVDCARGVVRRLPQ